MKMLRSLVWLILLAGTITVLTGCVTTEESENVSSRPWGYVRGYDPGLPSTMNEGR